MLRSLLLVSMMLAVLALAGIGCSNQPEGDVPKVDPKYTGKTGKRMTPAPIKGGKAAE